MPETQESKDIKKIRAKLIAELEAKTNNPLTLPADPFDIDPKFIRSLDK